MKRKYAVTATGVVRKNAKKLKGIGSAVATAAINKMSRSLTRTKTKGKRQSGSTVRRLGSGRARTKSLKKHPINRELKGKAKRFADKVQKAIAHNSNYGEYTYVGGKQLRQENIGKYTFYDLDYNGVNVVLGSLKAYQDAISICWANKPLRAAFDDTGGNINVGQTFNIVSENLSMFFKSTSAHVVNIEIFEFIAKHDQDEYPEYYVDASFNDFKNRYSDLNGAVESTFGIGTVGVHARHLVSVYEHYDIIVHKMKLEPGHMATKSFARKGKRYEMSKHLNVGNDLFSVVKGQSVFCFRVINDTTVSTTTSPVEPFVRHWPSNWRGGVAFEYHRVIRCAPLISNDNSVTYNRPTIAIAYHQPAILAGEADQQVVIQNPITATDGP